MTITSTLFKHKEKRNDTYLQVKDGVFAQGLQVKDGVFGQVEDILFIHNKTAAIILLRLFEKEKIRYKNTVEIPFPINQFPVKITDKFRTVVLTTSSYVQKIVRSDLKLKPPENKDAENEPPYPFFSIRPNPWFRF